MTEEQHLASRWLWENSNSALQLVAGAGSGKTTTLINAVIAAQKNFARPNDIALITFTRKAAHEMKERLHAQGYTAGYIGTMHALAYRLLKDQKKFTLLQDSTAILSQLVRDLFPALTHIPPEFLLTSPFIDPNDRLKLFYHFKKLKSRMGLLDFDDLIIEASQLPTIKALYRVLMVDEFQDTSPDQIEFIKALSPEKLLAVGDDWQSIYSFRGADVKISLEFSSHFSDVKRLFLTKNFRSTKRIVKLGNKAIRLSSSFIKKKLRSHHERGEPPRLYLAAKAEQPHEAFLAYQKFRLQKRDQEAKTFLVRTNLLRQAILPHLLPGDQVLTIHSAKGLEFGSVVVYGIAEHILPHRHGNYDEEVRLLYVAITRAQKNISFIAWESGRQYSSFLPFLAKHCRTTILH